MIVWVQVAGAVWVCTPLSWIIAVCMHIDESLLSHSLGMYMGSSVSVRQHLGRRSHLGRHIVALYSIADL